MYNERQRNVLKSVMYVQCCFAYKTNCFFNVVVVIVA